MIYVQISGQRIHRNAKKAVSGCEAKDNSIEAHVIIQPLFMNGQWYIIHWNG